MKKRIFYVFGILALSFAFMSSDSVQYFATNDCTTFYDEDGNLRQCPAGLYFNAAQQYCDFPEYSGCDPDQNQFWWKPKKIDCTITITKGFDEVGVWTESITYQGKMRVCVSGDGFCWSGSCNPE